MKELESEGDNQESDADDLDAEEGPKAGEDLCWKHLACRGCTSADCRFIHIDRQGMGWSPSTRLLYRLKRRVRALPDVKWNWEKIDSFELNRDIFC